MSKRKYSVVNYIESEECSNNKGLKDGEIIAKLLKKEPTFNFKSYLDGLCNGYTMEFKSIKENVDNIYNSCFETTKTDLLTYINHEKQSFNKGCKDGKILFKNNDTQFINFKCYLDGVCDGYTNYNILNSRLFNFKNSDCSLRIDTLFLENTNVI